MNILATYILISVESQLDGPWLTKIFKTADDSLVRLNIRKSKIFIVANYYVTNVYIAFFCEITVYPIAAVSFIHFILVYLLTFLWEKIPTIAAAMATTTMNKS